MAKLAGQNVIIQMFKAVPSDSSDDIIILDDEDFKILKEAIVTMIDDSSIVVEIFSNNE